MSMAAWMDKKSVDGNRSAELGIGLTNRLQFLVDSLCSFGGFPGESLHFAGDNREPSPCFAGAGRLDCCVQREDVGPLRNPFDQSRSGSDGLNRARQVFDELHGACRVRNGAGCDLLRLGRAVGSFLDTARHLSHHAGDHADVHRHRGGSARSGCRGLFGLARIADGLPDEVVDSPRRMTRHQGAGRCRTVPIGWERFVHRRAFPAGSSRRCLISSAARMHPVISSRQVTRQCPRFQTPGVFSNRLEYPYRQVSSGFKGVAIRIPCLRRGGLVPTPGVGSSRQGRTTTPPFITKLTRSMAPMSSRGFPGTATTSA